MSKKRKDEPGMLDEGPGRIEEAGLPDEVLAPAKPVPSPPPGETTICSLCNKPFQGTSTDHFLSEHS